MELPQNLEGTHSEFIFWDLMSFLQHSIAKVWGFYTNWCYCYGTY